MAPSTQTTALAVPIKSVSEALAEALSDWASNNRRRSVAPSPVTGNIPYPLPMTNLPDWPGAGTALDNTSGIPCMTISGMPPERYPDYASALVMYTMAQTCAMSPALAASYSSPGLMRTLTIAVLGRCHAWAAIGRTPPTSEPFGALRWSARLGKVVVRQAGTPDQDALWRHFLSQCPPLIRGTQELNKALLMIGPTLVTYAGGLLYSAGEAYALHMVERAMLSALAGELSPVVLQTFNLKSRDTLETMGAAAVSGYRASVVKHVASDPLFVTRAQMLLSPDDAHGLQNRLNMLGAETNGTTFQRGPIIAEPLDPHVNDDAESVADTEVLGPTTPMSPAEKVSMMFGNNGGENTPRPRSPVGADDIAAIHAFARRAQEEAPFVKSMVHGAMAEESVHF